MLTHDDIREELIRKLDDKAVRGKDVAIHLDISPARVTEMRQRTRRIQPEEAARLAAFLEMSGDVDPKLASHWVSRAPSADLLAHLLVELAPLWPSGSVTPRSMRSMAEALAESLALLERPKTIKTSLADIKQAAHGKGTIMGTLPQIDECVADPGHG